VTTPPHDLALERVVLSAVLCGEVTATELELRPSQLWGRLHQGAWAVALSLEELGRPVALAWVVRVLVGLGPESFAGARAETMLRQLGEVRGLMHTARAAQDAAVRLRELDRHRQLIRAMQRVDALLRLGQAPSPELVRYAVRRLEELDGTT
jgi:replicative DNA helicase